ncbi:MAG TPA: hypothetical protein ENK32_04585 [Anaerolineae bacterium]|nr:hypothetical protein [Anaerolineae bacterium]
MNLLLRIKLLSEAAFGRGDGVAGYVDQEVEYDAVTGLPFIRGRVVKGLLVEECANILYALPEDRRRPFEAAARFLFGSPGSGLNSQAGMRVGAARLPDDLREAVLYAVREENLRPDEVLSALTDLRRQTAVDHTSGVPEDGSLRAMRVLRRGLRLQADVTFVKSLPEDGPELALLGACAAAWRRGGIGRNRGRGRLEAYLESPERQAGYLQRFRKMCESRAEGDVA